MEPASIPVLTNETITTPTGKQIKTYGTREMVYNGLALKTAGNLTKDDIDLKIINGKEYYISKKISKRMKDLIKQSAIYKRKKTAKNVDVDAVLDDKACVNSPGEHIGLSGDVVVGHNINKTLKNVSFLMNKNNVKEVYYKELNEQDIEALRLEACSENTMLPPKPFIIEDLDSVDLDLGASMSV